MSRILNLKDIQAKSKIFIDSNIFIYHFTGASEQCSAFLWRCEDKEIKAYTSINTLFEVMHRLMMVEIVRKKLLKPPNLVKKLQKKPHLVKKLEDYFIYTTKISAMWIDILSIDYNAFLGSQDFRRDHGLLVNDSLIISSMKGSPSSTTSTFSQPFKNSETRARGSGYENPMRSILTVSLMFRSFTASWT